MIRIRIPKMKLEDVETLDAMDKTESLLNPGNLDNKQQQHGNRGHDALPTRFMILGESLAIWNFQVVVRFAPKVVLDAFDHSL
ncbi:hypothetical protein Tco_1132994 [Tanacetum coccineum]|uniref:Uncharacterized protein n=1 Tax=Tanacetum coccineum TaxID=301880 RepID=A0ABQ5JDM2_9ASTR